MDSHIDLPDRYGHGVVGSGCAMRVDDSSDGVGKGGGGDEKGSCEVYLPKGGVLVMTGDARYAWTHGIGGRFGGLVGDVLGSGTSTVLERGSRVSVTFRWLLPGADVVGTALRQDEAGKGGDSLP